MKSMSISTRMFLGKIVLGILWIATAISNLFESQLANVLTAVFLSLSVVTLTTIIMKANSGNDDEMSDFNYKEAKSRVSEIMHALFAILAVAIPFLFKFINGSLNLPLIFGSTFYVLNGIQNILVGIIFIKLEKE